MMGNAMTNHLRNQERHQIGVSYHDRDKATQKTRNTKKNEDNNILEGHN